MLGVPLEMVHRWWRILLIYISGVVAGSLAVSITDPSVYLAGASGGVYSLITAHLANVIFNWDQMEFAWLRFLTFIIIAGVDIGVAVYYRYVGTYTKVKLRLIQHQCYSCYPAFQVSYVAHIGGAVVGLLLGLVVLRNLKTHNWERNLWWICILLFLLLLVTAIIWNSILIFGK